jgi:hypothetical protein
MSTQQQPDLEAIGLAHERSKHRQACVLCGPPWPCDAYQLAAALAAEREQRARLETGLKYYADPSLYEQPRTPGPGVACYAEADRGSVARAALAPPRASAAPNDEKEKETLDG